MNVHMVFTIITVECRYEKTDDTFSFDTIALQAKLLKLNDCIDKALTSYPDVRAFMLKVQQQKEGIRMEQSVRLPQLSIHAEYDPQRTYLMSQNATSHII